MKKIISAAIVAMVMEAILCWLFSSFGEISFNRERDNNFIGSLIAFLHLPGIILSSLLQLPNNAFMVLVIFIGGVQWFVISLLVIKLWNICRRKNTTTTSPEPN